LKGGHRAPNPRPAAAAPGGRASWPALAGQEPARTALARSLALLPAEDRTVLALLCLDGLTEAEAAAALATTEARIRHLAAAARRQLRAALAGFDPDV